MLTYNRDKRLLEQPCEIHFFLKKANIRWPSQSYHFSIMEADVSFKLVAPYFASLRIKNRVRLVESEMWCYMTWVYYQCQEQQEYHSWSPLKGRSFQIGSSFSGSLMNKLEMVFELNQTHCALYSNVSWGTILIVPLAKL